MNPNMLAEQPDVLPPYFKVDYLYRDAGNYKQYGSVIFTNVFDISITYFVDLAKLVFIDGIYFDPLVLGIDTLYIHEYNSEFDHTWHELEKVSLTFDPPAVSLDISDFISNAMKSRSIGSRKCLETEFTF